MPPDTPASTNATPCSCASRLRRCESRKFELPPSMIVSPGSASFRTSWKTDSVTSPAGYRFFVDTLLRTQPQLTDEVAAAEIRRQVDSSRETSKELVASVSQLLSTVTRLAGVVTLPLTQKASITQIEFVGLLVDEVVGVCRQVLERYARDVGGQRIVLV